MRADDQPLLRDHGRMFFDDHVPPHFHARHVDGDAKVRIDTIEVIESKMGRRQLGASRRAERELAPRPRR
jgi:Domain of unknown function (DUF4160)